ncbi:hypothetical protein E3T55_16665 [Cryobacterium frigoriphilum]|uniref:Uncharacterized protein n=1 Tax=Cryobacterium frigoriphilum TaxID=1259150 RepID=A0A4R8ZVC2_9MICO|nr:hypothetical protein [Cryobacterium frigoriphilum]TFD46996.1 hypothetical protein E3T55_16665 [Cryobacterium frigoriphilum]
MGFDWAYLIPIAGIVGGITYGIFAMYFKSRRHTSDSSSVSALRDALATSNETNARLLAKLDSMDARLGSIERTLSEVG